MTMPAKLYKRLSDQQFVDFVQRRLDGGATLLAIGRLLGVNSNTVRHRLLMLGYKPAYQLVPTRADERLDSRA